MATDRKPTARNDRLTRRALIGSGVAAGLFAGQASATATIRPAGGTLRIAAAGPISVQSGALSEARALATTGTLFQTLTELSAEGTLSGELCKAWQSDRTAQVWTFQLRDGAQFSDGRLVTADEVVACLETHRRTRGRGAALLADVRSMKAPDPATIRISLWNPNPGFPLFLSDPQLAIRGTGSAGTGRYEIAAPPSADRLVLSRRADTETPRTVTGFDRVEMIAADTAEHRVELLAIGRVDLAVDVPGDALPDLQRRGRIFAVTEPGAVETVLRHEAGPRGMQPLSHERARPPSENVARALAVPLGEPGVTRHYLATLATWRTARDADERAQAERELDRLSAEKVLFTRDRISLASNRLRHGPRIGSTWGLDGSRIAARWWRA